MDENKFGTDFFEDNKEAEVFSDKHDNEINEDFKEAVSENIASEPVQEPFDPEKEQIEEMKTVPYEEKTEQASPVQQPVLTEEQNTTYVGNTMRNGNQSPAAYPNPGRNTYNQWQQTQNRVPNQTNVYPSYNGNPYQAPVQTNNQVPDQTPIQPNGQPTGQHLTQNYGNQLPGQYQSGGYMGGNNGYNYNQPVQQEPASPKNNGGKTILGIIIAVCLALAIGGMIAGILMSGGDEKEITTTVPTTQPQSQPPVEQSTTSENIEVSTTQPTTAVINSVFVAEKVRPSVVGVMAYYNGKLIGEGSGVLMSEDKNQGITYVVTCAHVISDDGATFGILLLDGTNIEAEMVAYDERTDIGVLKVKKTGLPLAEFGDSSTLRIGEPVYAIGNPGGSEYFGSITNGIVASIDRSVTSTYTMTCIQHNAAINPGNSGGALVNAAGQVIGINSSKIASTEYEGMGFAVPTSIAGVVVDSLIQYGYVPNRPKLGIEYAPVSSNQLYSLVVSIKELPQGSLVIAGISEGSSLVGTGAQVGDLIIAVNGKDMDDSSVLLDFIDKGSVGDELTLTLCRIESRTYKTTTFDVTITLIEDKPSKTEHDEPATEYDDDGYYHGGSESFEDFFNDYFGW